MGFALDRSAFGIGTADNSYDVVSSDFFLFYFIFSVGTGFFGSSNFTPSIFSLETSS
jgi:hypothetical protein